MPKRIQRKRVKNWKMPDRKRARYVGRPTQWGNPFSTGDRAADVAAFRKYILPNSEKVRQELRGFDLVCWCSLDQPCHADVLLEIANEWTPSHT